MCCCFSAGGMHCACQKKKKERRKEKGNFPLLAFGFKWSEVGHDFRTRRWKPAHPALPITQWGRIQKSSFEEETVRENKKGEKIQESGAEIWALFLVSLDNLSQKPHESIQAESGLLFCTHMYTHTRTHSAFAAFYNILVAAALLGTVGKHICSVPTHEEGWKCFDFYNNWTFTPWVFSKHCVSAI